MRCLALIPIICIFFCSSIGLNNSSKKVIQTCHKTDQTKNSHSDCPVFSKSYTLIQFKEIIQNKFVPIPTFLIYRFFYEFKNYFIQNFLLNNCYNYEFKLTKIKLLL